MSRGLRDVYKRQEWLEQVSIRKKASVKAEKKRGLMGLLAEVKW